MKEIVIYFSNGRTVRIQRDKARFVRLGQNTVEYTPDVRDGVAVINWDNVSFVREWVEPEGIDP